MSEKPASRWSANKGIARGILRDRHLRRRFIGKLLFLLLAVEFFDALAVGDVED